MADRSLFSTVQDNLLLEYGDRQIANQNNITSVPFDMTTVFENGFQIGSVTYDRLRVETNGRVVLRNAAQENEAVASVDEYLPVYNAVFNVFRDYSNNAALIPADSETAGIFYDVNEERNSIVITFSELPRAYSSYNYETGQYVNETTTSTTQLEFINVGEGEVEVVWRFNDIPDDYYAPTPSIRAQFFTEQEYSSTNLYFDESWVGEANRVDNNYGNTGIAGVWQMRYVDGVLQRATDFVGDTINGDDAANLLTGTAFGDLIGGRIGDDTIDGGYGNDSLYGGEGNDSITSIGGHNQVTGGVGNDTIETGAGNDSIDAGEGDDFVSAGAGSDTVTTGAGNDTIQATSGHNVIDAGAGEDEITITGNGYAQNTINGGTGASIIRAGETDDTILTDNEADFVNAGNGNNYVQTLLGDDTIRLGGRGESTVQAGGGDDLIDAGFADDQPSYYYYGRSGVFVSGQEGEDTILGSSTGDTLAGQDGNDSILAGSGQDEIHGGAGDDILAGGYGNDLMFGGDGDDFIYTSLGADTVTGGAGADRFFSSGLDQEFMHIMDYNPDEGDRLVMDNLHFDPGDFELRYLTALTVDGPVYRQIQLGWQAEDGYRGLFTFQNEPDISEILLRLSSEDGVDIVRFDLIPL